MCCAAVARALQIKSGGRRRSIIAEKLSAEIKKSKAAQIILAPVTSKIRAAAYAKRLAAVVKSLGSINVSINELLAALTASNRLMS